MPLQRFLTTVALFAIATTAQAQASIDQNKALAGGISPDDTPGFPITLSQPGHYILKSNLVVPNGVPGISITASNVTLDLNGFTVSGPGSCSYANQAVTCVGTSSEPGIVAGGSTTGTVLRNGTVRGFFFGVHVKNGQLSKMTASHNSLQGFFLGTFYDRGAVQGSELVAELNGGIGINAQWGGSYERLLARRNGGIGVVGYNKFSLVNNSVATENGDCGFKYGTVRGSVSTNNKLDAFCGAVLFGGNVADGAVN